MTRKACAVIIPALGGQNVDVNAAAKRPYKEVRPADATEGVNLDDQRSVLIVDPSEETREVLQTALQRRGVRTFSATRAAAALELARRHQPEVIVLDLELEGAGLEDLSAPFAAGCGAERPSLIMLGNIRRSDSPLPRGEFVPKPYHYAPLIRRIEELLDGCAIAEPRPCRRCS